MPDRGEQRYNEPLQQMEVWDGHFWVPIASMRDRTILAVHDEVIFELDPPNTHLTDALAYMLHDFQQRALESIRNPARITTVKPSGHASIGLDTSPIPV